MRVRFFNLIIYLLFSKSFYGNRRFLSAIKVCTTFTNLLRCVTINSYVGYVDSTSDFIPVSDVPCIIPRYSQIPWDASFVLRSQLVDPLMIVDIHVGIVLKDTFSVRCHPRFSFKRVSCYLQCNVVDSSLGESILWESASKSSSCCSSCGFQTYLLIK